MKSISDIIEEVIESPAMQKKFKKTAELMDNVNPSELCMLCGIHCGKEHMICPNCYGREKFKGD